MRSFKSAAARRVNEIRRTPGASVWQRNYYERVIRNEDELSGIREYIHVNPLKYGYVTRVQDCPYSTFHQYVHDGILTADWCDDAGDLPTVSD